MFYHPTLLHTYHTYLGKIHRNINKNSSSPKDIKYPEHRKREDTKIRKIQK